MTALTYSLQDIIKDRRYLNNPERLWGEKDYNYLIFHNKYVLKFNVKKPIAWVGIVQLFKEAGIDPEIDLNNLPHGNMYEIKKELDAATTELILNYGMAYNP